MTMKDDTRELIQAFEPLLRLLERGTYHALRVEERRRQNHPWPTKSLAPAAPREAAA